MKKLIIVILSCFLLCCCQEGKRVLIKEIIKDYTEVDSQYIKYGYYKEVKRVFNYEYKDSIVRSSMIDTVHGVHNYINEYGDTVYQIYINYINYPRREE